MLSRIGLAGPNDERTDVALSALVVACVIGAVGSLLFYLINVREMAMGGASGRLKWVSGLFVFCVVLISRIRARQGLEYAMAYKLALGCTMLIVLVRLGGSGSVVGGWLASLGIVVLVWYVSDFLTGASIIHDDDRDVSGQGVLTTIADDFSDDPDAGARPIRPDARPEQSDGEPDPPQEVSDRDLEVMLSGGRPWLDRGDEGRSRVVGDLGSDPRNPRRHPGVAIVYFSLAALVLFALGERFVAGGPESVRQETRRYAMLFAGSCLGLLMLTSLIAQRHYLKLRRIPVDEQTPWIWLGLGAAIVLIVLLLAWLVPAPTMDPSRWAMAAEPPEAAGRKTDSAYSAPFAGDDESTNKDADPPEGRNGREDSDQGDDKSEKQGEGEGKGKGKGEDEGKGEGEHTGDGKDESEEEGSGSGKHEDSEQTRERKQDQEQSSQRQNRAVAAVEKVASGLVTLLRWIVLLLLAIGAIYLLVKVAIAVGRNVDATRSWARALQERLNRLRERLARMFASLFARRRRDVGSGPDARETFVNPFRSRAGLAGLADVDAVRQCYRGLMAVAAWLGCPRSHDVTSVEYVRSLPRPLGPVRQEVMRLTEMYNRACYGHRTLDFHQRAELEKIYQRLGDFADRAV